MWIAVDTNQASLIPEVTHIAPSLAVEGVSLSPLVLAELLLFEKAKPRDQLARFPLRLGLETQVVMKRLAGLRVDEIEGFVPFATPACPSDEEYGDLLGAIRSPSRRHKDWAHACKQSNRAFGCDMQVRARKFRKAARERLGAIPKFDSLDAVLDAVGKSGDSFLGYMVTTSISHGDTRRLATTDSGVLYAAVMANPYLRRYFTTILVYLISFSRAWSHRLRALNFDANGERDDWTDMTLSLYAKSGDAIVTKDKKLRAAAALIGADVRTLSAQDLRQSVEPPNLPMEAGSAARPSPVR